MPASRDSVDRLDEEVHLREPGNAQRESGERELRALFRPRRQIAHHGHPPPAGAHPAPLGAQIQVHGDPPKEETASQLGERSPIGILSADIRQRGRS